jgi:WD40 repeat protein
MTHKTAPARPERPTGSPNESSPLVRVLGERRFHSDGDILALAFSPDDGLWSLEEPGILREWDRTTGKAIRSTFLSDVETLWAFSDDGRLLASASDEIIVWDIASQEMLTLLQQPSWVTAVAFRADPPLLVSGHDDGVARIWDLGDERVVHELRGHNGSISALAFSADGTRLASAGEDRNIRLWDVASGRFLGALERHTDRIVGLAWHPRGRLLASAAWDRTARLWDAESLEPLVLLNSHADQVTALAFSPDGSRLASVDSAHAIHLWDAQGAKIHGVLVGHKSEVRALAFSRDGQTLASAGDDRTVRLWDVALGRPLHVTGPQGEDRVYLAISRGGEQLASAGGEEGLHIWDVPSGKRLDHFEINQLTAPLAGSPDTRWLAGAGPLGEVRLWDAVTGKLERTFDGPPGTVSALAFSLDSRVLAAASSENATVWLWDVSTGAPVLVIPVAADGCGVQSLTFHPKGHILAAGGLDWLATSGSDGAVCLWDVVSRCRVATIRLAGHALAFDPCGRRLAGASSENSVFAWDLPSQMLAFRVSGHNDRVTAVAYSPNGKWLVSASDDRTIRLWTAETGQLWSIHDCETAIRGLAFSPDGSFLFTGNGNATSYQLNMQRLVEAGCKSAAGTPIRTAETKGQ